MHLSFEECFPVSTEKVYSYFQTPKDWPRLFKFKKSTKSLGQDWYRIDLLGFPFGLVAKNILNVPNRKVRWIFRGFWQGMGEVEMEPLPDGVQVRAFEYITPHGLWLAAGPCEKLFMEQEFQNIWEFGWKKLRAKKPVR